MDLFGSSGWPLLVWLGVGALVLAGAVAADARARGQRAVGWFLLALLFPGFGALVYLVLRPPGPPGSERAALAPEAPVVPAATPEAPSGEGTAAAPASHGGPVEWRRGVGVLPDAAAPEPPVRPAPRRRAGVPPWLVGAAAAVLVLVVVGGFGLPRLTGPAGAPAPTPTAVRAAPTPVAAPALEATPAAEAPPEPSRTVVYVVEPGDTLGGIARDFGTTVEAIMTANNLEDPDRLIIGQELLVPQ
jgi:hypothetical protein